MAYDLATKPEVRHQTVEGFVAIKDQVADDPTSIFPMFKEIVIEEATGLSTDNFSELDVGTGRGQHLACKGTVRTVATVLAGGKFLSKLPKMADDLAAKLLNAKLWKKFKKAPGFTDEMLIAFKKNLKELLEKIPEATESMIKIADFTSASELMDIVAKLNKLKELDGITTLISDMGTYWTKFKGSEFVLDYASKLDKALIAGKKVKFEVKEIIKNASGEVVDRIYDLTIDGVKYELKAWTKWQKWSDVVIRKQFIRDLASETLTDIEKLNWIFKKTDDIPDVATLKSKVINALKGDLSKIEDAFDEDMVKKMFPADKTIRRTNYAEKLIENLDKTQNFERIFKVVE